MSTEMPGHAAVPDVFCFHKHTRPSYRFHSDRTVMENGSNGRTGRSGLILTYVLADQMGLFGIHLMWTDHVESSLFAKTEEGPFFRLSGRVCLLEREWPRPNGLDRPRSMLATKGLANC